MYNVIKFVLMGVMSCSFAASAALIESDYLGVQGGITYDSSTNYEWLDLSFTSSMTLAEYQNYLTSLDDNWLFASSALVSNLFAEFGVTAADDPLYGTATSAGALHLYQPPTQGFLDQVQDISILGEYLSDVSQFFGIKGFTSDIVANVYYEQFMMYHSKSLSVGVISLGDYIHKADGGDLYSFFTYREKSNDPVVVSEPSILILFVLSIFFIARLKCTPKLSANR